MREALELRQCACPAQPLSLSVAPTELAGRRWQRISSPAVPATFAGRPLHCSAAHTHSCPPSSSTSSRRSLKKSGRAGEVGPCQAGLGGWGGEGLGDMDMGKYSPSRRHAKPCCNGEGHPPSPLPPSPRPSHLSVGKGHIPPHYRQSPPLPAGQVTFQWGKFTNPARSDGLQLEHWIKCYKDAAGRVVPADPGPYPFAKYNKKVCVRACVCAWVGGWGWCGRGVGVGGRLEE